MNGSFHRISSIIVLILFQIILFKYILNISLLSTTSLIILIQISLGWIAQTLRYNNDLDHPKYREHKGILKYIFMFTHHKGALHKVKFWIIVCVPLALLGFVWVGVGVLGSAITHIVVDKVSFKWKRFIPNWIGKTIKKVL